MVRQLLDSPSTELALVVLNDSADPHAAVQDGTFRVFSEEYIHRAGKGQGRSMSR